MSLLSVTLFLAIALLLVGLIYRFRRRMDLLRSTVPIVPLPADLDAYLLESEASVRNLRPGLHKQIVWADPDARTRTGFAIVYIHGFSASSAEIRPVPDIVASRLGANVFYTRLNGHGADGDALGRARLGDWQHDVAEAIAIGERVGERVIIMAMSTGAALVTWALAKPELSRNVSAAVLISPNYGLKARGAFLLNMPFARWLVRLVIGRERAFTPVNDLQAEFWTTRYASGALLPMAQSIRLARSVPFETISVPALLLYSPYDWTVDPASIVRHGRRWGAPCLLKAVDQTDDPNGHVLAGRAISPSTTDSVAAIISDWLHQHCGPHL